MKNNTCAATNCTKNNPDDGNGDNGNSDNMTPKNCCCAHCVAVSLPKLARRPHRDSRERVWDAVRQTPDAFTRMEIAKKTKVDYSHVQAIVGGWQKAGYVSVIEKKESNISTELVYELLKDTGNEPPRVDYKGKYKAQTTNELMWRTLKIIGNCNASQLSSAASTDEITVTVRRAKKYLRLLCKAGYLTLVSKGRGRKQAVYRLTLNTGAKPPQILKTEQVYDANCDQVVYRDCINAQIDEVVA